MSCVCVWPEWNKNLFISREEGVEVHLKCQSNSNPHGTEVLLMNVIYVHTYADAHSLFSFCVLVRGEVSREDQS